VTLAPPLWTKQQLKDGIAAGALAFRKERVEEPVDQYLGFYNQARAAVENLLELTVDLSQFRDLAPEVWSGALVGAARYLASPPLSVDDLVNISGTTISPKNIAADANLAFDLADTVLLFLDRERFPWISETREPTEAERHTAIVSTSAMMAMRLMETFRRTQGKNSQEDKIKQFLVEECGFTEVPKRDITNLSEAPAPGEFCGEVLVGSRRADIPVRLWDGRLMPIECKVSNSATNSYKRINNDAAVKAQMWKSELGSVNVVPAAAMSGVFALAILEYAQDNGLTLWWVHELETMKAFIDGTKP
jgi:hypothetical protein